MYKYIGNGRYLVGVPAKDLTEKEVERLPKHLQHSLKTSGLYRKSRKRKGVKDNGD